MNEWLDSAYAVISNSDFRDAVTETRLRRGLREPRPAGRHLEHPHPQYALAMPTASA